MGKTAIVITTDSGSGIVQSRMENINANPIDLAMILGELELIKLQILTMIQKNRQSKTKEI